MSNPVKIAVLGGGNGAFAAAADLRLRGFAVHLLEVPELAENIGPVRDRGGIELVSAKVPGIRSGFASLDVVTEDPEEALDEAEIVLYIVPAFAERRFTELCAPHFRSEQLVVLFCGNFGSALELSRQLETKGADSVPSIAETEALIYGAYKQDRTTVKVVGMKAGLTCAALAAKKTSEVLERLRPLFPDLRPAANVLETSLRNLNPVIHPVVSVLNAGRTGSDNPPWRYYWDGVTESVGRVVEVVDRERLAMASALALRLPSALDVLRSWYGRQGAQGQTLGEMLSKNPAYEAVWAPRVLDHRFITEDVPFGLVPLEALGASIGVPTPHISSLINLSSRLLDTDFRTCGRNLVRIGLDGLDLARIKHKVEEG